MKTLYAIRDRLANDLVGSQMYLTFAFKSDTQAVRYFADALLDDKSVLSKHPNDYELIKVGLLTDDGSLGSIDGMKFPLDPVVVITGSALVAAQQPQSDQDR